MGNMMQGSSFGSMLLAASLTALGPSAASAEEWTLTTLYSFKGGGDGQTPDGGVVADASGALYGTTQGADSPDLWGTIFKVTPPSDGSSDWTEQVLLHFPGGASGYAPAAGVIFGPAGSLYGTAFGGGTTKAGGSPSGVTYRLYPPAPSIERWHPSLVYSFANGDQPHASLLHGPGNVLYGTAATSAPAGSSGRGSAFVLAPPAVAGGAWTLSYLHIFTGLDGDGARPEGALIADASGALYGTTSIGGLGGEGIVFKLTPPAVAGGTWTETILHTFLGESTDGADPNSALVMDKKGVLYGTTGLGGTKDLGTIFQLTPPTSSAGKWGYSVLHNFAGPDGAIPASPLLLGATGEFYGTTSGNGNGSYGTVFRLTPPATEGGKSTVKVLYSFSGATDGSSPSGPLLLLHSALYGTTETGGSEGNGTVFELAASP